MFLTTPDEVEEYVKSNSCDNCIHYHSLEIWNLSDLELQLVNTKTMIKNNLK